MHKSGHSVCKVSHSVLLVNGRCALPASCLRSYKLDKTYLCIQSIKTREIRLEYLCTCDMMNLSLIPANGGEDGGYSRTG